MNWRNITFFVLENKVSKFNNLSTKQPSGDQGLSEEDDHKEE